MFTVDPLAVSECSEELRHRSFDENAPWLCRGRRARSTILPRVLSLIGGQVRRLGEMWLWIPTAVSRTMLGLCNCSTMCMPQDSCNRVRFFKSPTADQPRSSQAGSIFRSLFRCFPLPYSCFRCFRFGWSPRYHPYNRLHSTFGE